jgi:hypothetical protein
VTLVGRVATRIDVDAAIEIRIGDADDPLAGVVGFVAEGERDEPLGMGIAAAPITGPPQTIIRVGERRHNDAYIPEDGHAREAGTE